MKASVIASLTALALAGTACSDAPQKEAEAPQATPAATEIAAPVDDGFNLPVPGETAAPLDDGFNLTPPGSAPALSDDGFSLPTDLPSSVSLDDIPSVDTPVVQETAPPEPSEDTIIRLEPK